MFIFRYVLCLLSILPLTNAYAQQADKDYKLSAGDVISIRVYDEPDLSFDKLLVGDNGAISYPFLGEVQVTPLTIDQVKQKLIAGLKPDYLIDPKVSVGIVEYRPFFINGQVKKPGGYPYQPGLTLRQAVTLAQGFTERASKTKIFVIPENSPDGTVKQVDLNYAVKPGDTITVEQSFF